MSTDEAVCMLRIEEKQGPFHEAAGDFLLP
jgi:hypothetical protein